MSETNGKRNTSAAGSARTAPGSAKRGRRTAPMAGRAAARTGARAKAGGRQPAGFDAARVLGAAGRLAKRAGAGLRRGLSALKRDGKPKARGPRLRQNLLKSRFYRIYFGLLALAVILIAVGTAWLSGVLKDYESAQPIYVAEEVAKVFEDRDFDRLYTMDASAQSIANGDQAYYVDTMRGITAGKDIAWSEAFSTDENEKRYTVTVGSDRFASFTLVPSGETTPRGNRLWKLGSVDTNVVTETELDETLGERVEYRVTAPEGYTVTVDGTALTAQDAVRTGITLLPDDFLPKDVTQVKLTQYAFESRAELPEISVTDAAGAAQALRETGENTWACGPSDNAEFRQRYASGIEKLAKQMAKYTSNDISRSDMLRNALDESPAYDIIKKFSNYWAPTHKYAEFKNMQVSDCIIWSNNCFTCHVTFDFILRTRRGTEMTYPTAYTFCIVKRGSKAKIYNLQMN